MGNRVMVRRHLDPDIFKQFLKDHNMSIRQLGMLIDTNEKTIRRCIKQEAVTLTIAIDICKFFDSDFDTVFGKDDSLFWQRSRMEFLKMLR